MPNFIIFICAVDFNFTICIPNYSTCLFCFSYGPPDYWRGQKAANQWHSLAASIRWDILFRKILAIWVKPFKIYNFFAADQLMDVEGLGMMSSTLTLQVFPQVAFSERVKLMRSSRFWGCPLPLTRMSVQRLISE